jgi:hypothetical protein
VRVGGVLQRAALLLLLELHQPVLRLRQLGLGRLVLRALLLPGPALRLKALQAPLRVLQLGLRAGQLGLQCAASLAVRLQLRDLLRQRFGLLLALGRLLLEL